MFTHKNDRQVDRRVTVSKEIDAPSSAIFDLLADPSKHPLLDGSGTVIASRGAPARLALGSRFAMQMRLGLPYRIVNTVVELDEGRRIAWRHLSGHRWIWQLEPTSAGRTRVSETFDWSTAHTPGLIELLGYPARNEKGMIATLDRLEELLAPHADGSAPPAAGQGGTSWA
jgi:uncharacterized protein YndB with AHSA1/START domain